MGAKGAKGNFPGGLRTSLVGLGLLALAITCLLTSPAPDRSNAETRANAEPQGGILPCGSHVVLTAVYRNRDGRIHFEGVADPKFAGRQARIYDRDNHLVAATTVGEDGIFWANANSKDEGYTWLTRFIARVGGSESRWKRIGQAVGLRDRQPFELEPTARNHGKTLERTRVRVKVAGGHSNLLVVGLQVGCSRFDVIELASTYTDSNGVSDLNLPRPPADRPYWIFRVSTEDDWKISPPIVVKSVPESGPTG